MSSLCEAIQLGRDRFLLPSFLVDHRANEFVSREERVSS